MVASSERAARGRRLARVEVFAGVLGFVLALAIWALQLFAPVYLTCGRQLLCHPSGRRISLVDSVRGLGNFVGYFPGRGIGQFILAFLVLTGVVALGAYLHGGRSVALGRWLVWGGCLLEALLLPAVVYTLSFLPLSVAPAMLFQILPGGNILMLGLALCAGLAVMASVAAGMQRGAGERAGGSTLAARTTWSVAATWVEILAGMATFATALLTWAIALFAPLYQDISTCDRFGCRRLLYVSVLEEAGGLGTLVRQHSGIALLILVFLVAAGMVGVGAYLHGGRHVSAGRWLIWGGSMLVLVLIAAMSELSVYFLLPSSAPVDPRLPYQTWPGAEVIAGIDLLALVVGPSLCAGLAVIASVAAVRADVA